MPADGCKGIGTAHGDRDLDSELPRFNLSRELAASHMSQFTADCSRALLPHKVQARERS
jgi:hypothetical protein